MIKIQVSPDLVELVRDALALPLFACSTASEVADHIKCRVSDALDPAEILTAAQSVEFDGVMLKLPMCAYVCTYVAAYLEISDARSYLLGKEISHALQQALRCVFEA